NARAPRPAARVAHQPRPLRRGDRAGGAFRRRSGRSFARRSDRTVRAAAGGTGPGPSGFDPGGGAVRVAGAGFSRRLGSAAALCADSSPELFMKKKLAIVLVLLAAAAVGAWQVFGGGDAELADAGDSGQ